MNFGKAIEELKQGNSVQREGWNGKNMYIYLQSSPVPSAYFSGFRKYDPVVCMVTVQSTHQVGWLASQADMLAEDWDVVVPVTE